MSPLAVHTRHRHRRPHNSGPLRFAVIVAASCACVHGADTSYAGPHSPRDLVERLRTSVVRIGVVDSDQKFLYLGTGFVVDEHCVIATANHVVLGSVDYAVVMPSIGEGKPAGGIFEILRRYEKNDIAFLGLKRGQLDCATYSHLRPLPLPWPRQRELNGAEVLIAGFPLIEKGTHTHAPVYRRGIIASGEFGVPSSGKQKVPMYLLDLTGIPGFSGSPVLLVDSGELIGLIHGPRKTERKYDLEWATPLLEIQYKLAVSPTDAEPGEP